MSAHARIFFQLAQHFNNVYRGGVMCAPLVCEREARCVEERGAKAYHRHLVGAFMVTPYQEMVHPEGVRGERHFPSL